MRPFVPVCYRVLPSDALAYFASRVGREVYGWDDAHIPRTEKPVRFVWRAPFGLCWGMVNKWAKLPRPFVA